VIREYTNAYAAVSPINEVMNSPILPGVNTNVFALFLDVVATHHLDEFVIMFVDSAAWDLWITERAWEVCRLFYESFYEWKFLHHAGCGSAG